MITIYKTKHCAYCKMVAQFLTDKKVEYTEVQLEEHPEKRQELWNMGYRTVPVTSNGKDYVLGYNRKALSELIDV